jgi:NAD(P)-dependent dehydrogenase (short-subunit alcohol dehydrogenase family)
MTTVSLVTGGNRGIGREVGRQLAERGHTVVLTARSAEAAATAARAVHAEPATPQGRLAELLHITWIMRRTALADLL